MPETHPRAWDLDPSEFVLSARPAFRPTDKDRRNAAIVARHIEAAGRTPTATLIFRAALAKAAMELDPPNLDNQFVIEAL